MNRDIITETGDAPMRFPNELKGDGLVLIHKQEVLDTKGERLG